MFAVAAKKELFSIDPTFSYLPMLAIFISTLDP